MLSVYALSPLAQLLNNLFNLYELVLIVRVVCSWVPVNRASTWYYYLYRATEPVMAAARRALPPRGGVDYSPILAYFAVDCVRLLLIRTF